MFEPYLRTPGLRLPLVMTIVTRDTLTPQSVWGGHQDAMSVREVGWVQMYCESVQEVLDTTIMAYKIAEHHDVMLPVNVCHDGNYLSFGAARCELPEQGEVNDFLGEKDVNWHVALDPQRPMAVDPLTGGAGGPGPSTFVRYRKGQCGGMQNSLRSSPRCTRNGAALRPLPCAAGRVLPHGRRRVRHRDHRQHDRRGQGRRRHAARARRKVGLVKVKTYRPFPLEALVTALAEVKARRRGRPLGVLRLELRAAVYQDTMAALYQHRKPHSGDELHRRARRRRPHRGAFRARDRD